MTGTAKPKALHSLSLRNLSKRYGGVAAVDNISLVVKPGEFITLLGPSGSGKTTLLMLIAGFVDPSSGDVLVDDRVITHHSAESRNFGMVFQGYALFPHLTVAGNVDFPLKVRGRPRNEREQLTRQALELVQMGHLADRLPKQLSGGQQQRVALARALSFEPDLLLLDEPLSALDKKLRTELQRELKSLHQRLGTTFIYVTHDQEEALAMSDRIAIIRDGKVEQIGAPNYLYEKPATRFVADFLGKSNFIRGIVDVIRKNEIEYDAGGIRLTQSMEACAAKRGDRVLVALRPEKILVTADRLDSAPNALHGRIQEFTYVGANYYFLVKTAPLGEISVTTPAWRCSVDPATGNNVWLSWSADASVLLSEE